MRSDEFEGALERELRARGTGLRLAVALSGGPDSSALLFALSRLWNKLIDAGVIGSLRAIHVEHGLHPDSGSWAQDCKRLCDSVEVPITILQVIVPQDTGESLEELAREARYGALSQDLGEGELLLTGHSADDQAETFLLQLLRGAGPAGLSAMPSERPLGQGALWRPLLAQSRRSFSRYAAQHRLSPVDDPANHDPRFDRTFVRSELLPMLESRWPAARRVLQRNSEVQAETAQLLDDLGTSDLNDLGDCRSTLPVSGLSVLYEQSPARARNALRTWLHRQGLRAPSRRRLQLAFSEVLGARRDADPRLSLGPVVLRRYRDRLYLVEPGPGFVGFHRWSLATPISLPGGQLAAVRCEGQGIAVRCLPGGEVEVRGRQGGERLEVAGRAGTRTVKKLLQEAGIPPWQRAQLPLIYDRGRLAAVAGLWVATEYCAAPREPGWLITWRFSRRNAELG